MRRPGLCVLSLGLFGCTLGGGDGGGTAWLPLDDQVYPGLYRLSTAEKPPVDDLPGPLFAHRRIDDQRHALYDEQGEWLDGLSPGAYVTADGVTVIVRDGEGVAQQALRWLAYRLLWLRMATRGLRWRETRKATMPWHYSPTPWRLADRKPWPWVSNFGMFGGLLTYIERLHGDEGLSYDPQQQCYVDDAGRPRAHWRRRGAAGD